MIRHVSWLLLGLSVLFNAFFLAGYLQARTAPTQVEPPSVEPVSKTLDLDDGQNAVLSGCRESLGEDAPLFRNALALVGEEMRRELEREEPDLARLADLSEREAELHKQWHLAKSDQLFQFVSSLRPDQRSHLMRAVSRSPRHAARMQRMMRGFDEDGDGRLNDAEAAAAQEAVDGKRREIDQYRARMLERFDADGDGELNDEEQAAMRRYRMQRRRDGTGRPDGRPGGPRGDRRR